eukprot:TRINITY_DN47549_c0_g1_i1.p1 TRINITY_DN47549_c0_g1~~TRINITY_DN47549_c0_g1_i1.p1  ORF type:complete len:502 (+),score=137.18 TRINITY_DN47549_c0_g1_i1:64-1506(+)
MTPLRVSKLRRTVSAPGDAPEPHRVGVRTCHCVDPLEAVDAELSALREWLLRRFSQSSSPEHPATHDDVAESIHAWAVARTCHLDAPVDLPLQEQAPTGDEAVTVLRCTHTAINIGIEHSQELLGDDRADEGGLLLEQTSRLIDWHMRLEDQVLFPALSAASTAKTRLSRSLCHDAAELREAQLRRTLVAQFRSGCASGQSRAESMAKLRLVAARSRAHMQEEEEAVSEVLQSADLRTLQELAPRLIDFDTRELITHVVPFTVRQLCLGATYVDGLQPYSRALTRALTSSSVDVRARFARAMLVHAWEVQPRYAAALLSEGLLNPTEQLAHLPSDVTVSQPPPGPNTGRSSVMRWLEETTGNGNWGWRDVQAERTHEETSALLAAEQMHEHLAAEFASSMQLKHVVVEEDAERKDIRILFFIDATWDVARRTLFAKAYTRRHKPRAQKMKVFVIDAKLRRALLKAAQDDEMLELADAGLQ